MGHAIFKDVWIPEGSLLSSHHLWNKSDISRFKGSIPEHQTPPPSWMIVMDWGLLLASILPRICIYDQCSTYTPSTEVRMHYQQRVIFTEISPKHFCCYINKYNNNNVKIENKWCSQYPMNRGKNNQTGGQYRFPSNSRRHVVL